MKHRKRTRTISSTKVVSFIFLMLGMLMSFSMFFICWKIGDRKIPLKEELVRKVGVLENYQYVDGKYRGGRGMSNEFCKLSLKESGDYIIAPSTMDGFDRSRFEQEAQVGDGLVLFIDEKSQTDGCFNVAEIWRNETCYLRYEAYVDGQMDSKKAAQFLQWWGFVPLLVFGSISYGVWRGKLPVK